MKTEEDVISYLDKLNNLCCICLCENLKNSPAVIENLKTLHEKVWICTRVEFLNNETLPTVICENCCKELDVADQFRIKCENSNKILRNIYKQYLEKDEDKQIVIETKELNEKGNEQNVYFTQTYDSDDEPLGNSVIDYSCSESFQDDNKDKLKDIIKNVNLKSDQVGAGKSKKIKKKTKSSTQKKQINNKLTSDIVKTEVDDIKVEKDEILNTADNINKLDNIVTSDKLICDTCHKPLKDKRSLIRHITTQHSPEKMKDQMFKVTGYGPERRFHCADCPHTTRRKIDMKIHSRIHSGYKPYVCNVCNRSFSQYGTLAGHKKTHSDTKYYTCQECGKQFKYRETLKSHMRVHSNEYNFICHLCNKGLKTAKSLTFHMKRHYRIKNHNCELCGATFVTRAELTKHKYTHENRKRFQCTQCDYSSIWRHSLEIHTRRHLKDKSVQCDQCEYACYTGVELRLHKRKHSKEQHYSCPMCDEKFKQSTSVNKHMLNKHGKKFLWGNVADRRFIK